MPLVVYKSSAGSGKTTTLVQAYLKITLNNPMLFRNVLSITFTNKAANEMKSRVLEWLSILSEGEPLADDELKNLQNELALSDSVLQERAKELLSLIIHNYDEFAISTIDSFVHRIIKTFATDIKLPQNFEVVIEEEEIIPEIIQDLYEKVGVDKDITSILINFVMANFEDEKAHDPTNQLYSFIQKQIQEEGFFFIRKLRDVSLSDFQHIIQRLRHKYQGLKKEISGLACETIDLIQKSGIEPGSFYQGKRGIYNYFEKNCGFKNDSDIIPNSYAIKTVEENNWYGGKCPADQKASIDAIKDKLNDSFNASLQLGKRYMMYSMVYRKIYDVALIREIRLLFDDYADRNQKVHISEFNKKISESIAGQPVPFIYERLGRRYRYFLIDEFQDTSVLQWQNLMPLLEESLAYGHYNMLVGDAKQAIYRFRNGEVELFSSLPKLYPKAETDREIAAEKFLKSHYKEVILGLNYRSDKVIVNFNNSFFKTIYKGLQGRNKKVYEGHHQRVKEEKENENTGYVKIELIEAEKTENYREIRLKNIRNNIEELKSKGYQDKDICVLTNQNKYATEIASYLIENGYQIISNESLLLKNSPEVRMIIALFKLLLNTGDQIQLANFIENLLVIRNHQDSFHGTFSDASSHLKNGIDRLMMHLGYPTVKEEEMSGLSVYEITEYAVSHLFGKTNNNIFLHFFLDFAYDNQHLGDGSLASFVEYWEKKCDKTYITMPDGVNAIQVMTVHKAKGLKFESVILDFIPRNDKTTRKDYWTDLELDGFSELHATMLPLVKDLEFVDLEHIYSEEVDKTELDLLNMIYVAFTRPVSALFILSQKKEKTQNRFTAYIQNFLTKQALKTDEKEYAFGELKKSEKKKEENLKQQKNKRKVLKDMLSDSWKGKIKVAASEPVYWELMSSTPADIYGNLVHKMLSEVFVFTDVSKVVTRYNLSGIIDEHEANRIQQLIEDVVNHKELKAYFNTDVMIKNETEIITLKNGNRTILRPDRVVIQDDELIVIDYKTGERNIMHIEQISAYAEYFNQLGYENVKKMLVYLNETIEVLSV
jgi:ATP-dependent exoDNAse (exonuclease V) beta subunit